MLCNIVHVVITNVNYIISIIILIIATIAILIIVIAIIITNIIIILKIPSVKNSMNKNIVLRNYYDKKLTPWYQTLNEQEYDI